MRPGPARSAGGRKKLVSFAQSAGLHTWLERLLARAEFGVYLSAFVSTDLVPVLAVAFEPRVTDTNTRIVR